jgi:ethanolamine permease
MYPFAPLWTLAGVAVCLASIVYYNKMISLFFCGLLVVGYVLVRVAKRTPVGEALTVGRD